MKQFFIFVLIVAPLILSAQATVNNSGVFTPTDLTTHNIVMKNGKELGRIVEYGKYGMFDKELAEVVSIRL